MAATWSLLSRTVGPGLRNRASDVRSLKQLLTAAGYDVGGDGGTWDEGTTRALLAFSGEQFSASFPLEVAPESDELPLLARLARIEIPLPRASGMDGIQRMHDWFVERATKYNDGAEKGLGNRAIFGIQGHGGSAIQRINQAWRAGPV